MYKSPGYGISLDPYALDDNIKLIPDRWSHTGWKNANTEPSEQIHGFFSSPNRMNSLGYSKNQMAFIREKQNKSALRGSTIE